MKVEYKKVLWPSVISSGVLLLLGLLLFFNSAATLMTISYVLGGLLIALGVIALGKFISSDKSDIFNQLNIVYGVICVLSGIFFIKEPTVIGSIIPVVLGLAIILSSSLKIQQAFVLKNLNSNYFIWSFVTALLSLVCGVVLLFNPFKGALIITKVIGIFLTIYAISDIINTIVLKKSNVVNVAISSDVKKPKAKKTKDKAKDASIVKEVEKEDEE